MSEDELLNKLYDTENESNARAEKLIAREREVVSLRSELEQLKAKLSKMRGKLLVADSLWEHYKSKNAILLRDMDAYRGALGYSIPAGHDGNLADGTTPECGICNSEHHKNLELENARLLAALHKFGYHEAGCRLFIELNQPCTCGLHRAAIDSTALRDLLAPTIELLEKIECHFPHQSIAVANELARLRALTERKS